MTALRIVSPYRQNVDLRHSQHGFDWVAALTMLRASADTAMPGTEVVALTDETTPIPRPVLRYPTTEPWLMLWILEVSLAYLQSEQFDRDTVLLSPDTLLVGDLRPYFAGDLTIMVRPQPKFVQRPVLNAVQWWPVAAKARSIAFYQQALALARTLSDKLIKWGADSEALRLLLEPIEPGMQRRGDLDVCMRDAHDVLRSAQGTSLLEPGKRPAPIVDFKYERKAFMAGYFQNLTGAPA